MNILRIHIERQILSSFINQQYTHILDEIEFKDMRLPFELFLSNRAIKMTAKAIYNLQEEKKPIDDLNVLCYIEKHASINEVEWLEIIAKNPLTFDTMNLYMNQLREMHEEQIKNEILESI